MVSLSLLLLSNLLLGCDDVELDGEDDLKDSLIGEILRPRCVGDRKFCICLLTPSSKANSTSKKGRSSSEFISTSVEADVETPEAVALDRWWASLRRPLPRFLFLRNSAFFFRSSKRSFLAVLNDSGTNPSTNLSM